MNNIKRFFCYLSYIAFVPRRTTRELLDASDTLSMGMVAAIFFGALYSPTVLIGYHNGLGPEDNTLWLRISPERYYLWQGFYTLPVHMVGLILLSGGIQLLAHVMGGRGTFEKTFAAVAVAQPFPLIVSMWLPETLVMSFLPHLWEQHLGLPIILDTSRVVLGTIWSVGASIGAISVVQEWSLKRATLATLLVFIPAGLIMATYIR